VTNRIGDVDGAVDVDVDVDVDLPKDSAPSGGWQMDFCRRNQNKNERWKVESGSILKRTK